MLRSFVPTLNTCTASLTILINLYQEFIKLNCNEDIELTWCHHKRDFIHVSDVASFGSLLAISPTDLGTSLSLDVGHGSSMSFKKFIEMLKFKMSSTSNLRFGKIDYEHDLIWDSYARPSLIKVDWSPQLNIEKGIERMIKNET